MSEEILGILKSHGEQLKSQSEQLTSHGELFKSHGEQLDLIAMKVVEHDGRFERIEENMATKTDIREISNTLDKLVQLHQKKDQELTMVAHGMRRHEDRIENTEQDIRQMKPLLGLS
jgi:chromosome segregation ATPase